MTEQQVKAEARRRPSAEEPPMDMDIAQDMPPIGAGLNVLLPPKESGR